MGASQRTGHATDEPRLEPGRATHVRRILAQAIERPYAPALRTDEDGWTLSFEELATAAIECESRIRLCIATDRPKVAALLPSGPALVVAYLGTCLMAGVFAAVDPVSSSQDRDHIMKDFDPDVVITTENDESRYEGAVNFVIADDLWARKNNGCVSLGQYLAAGASVPDLELPALVWYTSGTTSRSKGVVHTYRTILAHHQSGEAMLDLWPTDRLLCPLPLHSGFGLLTVVSQALYSGCSVTIQRRFRPDDALRLIERDQITAMLGVPAMYAMMKEYLESAVNDGGPRSMLPPRYDFVAWSSGAPLNESMRDGFERVTGARLLSIYGLSECPIAAIERRRGPHRTGTAGRVCPGFTIVAIGDDDAVLRPGEEGALLISGPTLMSEYLNLPHLTAERVLDGVWFRTGDRGFLDDEENVVVLGRADDMIIRGGYNVAPIEIEEALGRHPAVLEVAVVGKHDDILGQRIIAFVVARTDAATSHLCEDLRTFAQRILSKPKWPDSILLLPTLPRNPVGKVVRSKLPDV